MTRWIGSGAFSLAAGISDRKARRAFERAACGKTWNGHTLQVRTMEGRGGKSGLQYQVKVSSLPAHIQDRLKALQIHFEDPSKTRLGEGAQLKRTWIYDVIRPALAYPKGSNERGQEVAKLHGAKRLNWQGKHQLLSKSVLYRWIDQYECGGIHALGGKVRSDKGARKVYISRAWTNAVPFDEQIKATIHDDLKAYVRGLIKGDGQFKQTRVLASEKLISMTGAYGFRINDPQREAKVFSIPAAFIREEAHFKAVARHQKDRKASEDDKPRIRRTTAALEPNEVNVMDVHHLNIYVARPDGTYSTPKLIAFHDIATNRVFCELIQFSERGGVRNTDIITAFVNMCQHPAFGVPQYLYVDNGSEYRFADDLEDALKLGTRFVTFDGPEERRRIIRAKPYNAAAKQVEGWFRQFNQQHARHIDGWRDDDPMNPKRPELGKLHAPYPHGFDAFCDEFYSHLTAYEHMPQKGQIKTSPALAFKDHVRRGWKANVLDADRLTTVFTKPETRVVKKHGIEVRGAAWTCDGLLSFFGRTVLVHIPKYHGFAELLVTDERGNEIGVAVADRAFDVLDDRGAQESSRRVSIRNKALTKLDKSAPDIDVGAELIAYGQRQVPVIPNEPDATISVTRPGSQKRALPPVEVERRSRLEQDEELRRQNSEASAIFAQIKRTAGNTP
jgi:hypothetical protein